MTWPKHLSVDKRIISLLSASTYESFPKALRELVSNAYDADATRVDISIDDVKNVVVIEDNGSGMTPDEFDFFLRIAGKQRTRKRTTVLGRKRVGQFGIGFLAMFPFCEIVEVESTVAGSPIIFRARIPAAQFFSESAKAEDLTIANITGREIRDQKKINDHYTIFRLEKTTRLLHRYLQQQADLKSKISVRSYSGRSRLIWELQDILPLGFPAESKVAAYVDPTPADFVVTLNNVRLQTNDYVEDVLGHSNGIKTVGEITFRYAIGTPWHVVKPEEGRGLRVRLNNVGVGDRTYFDLGIAGRTFSRLGWLTGEISIISGLDEAITLDRDSFTASQDYDNFREFFRTKIREMAFFVEEVDEAKRKISAQTSSSVRAETAPTAQVIQDQVGRLKRRGFTVENRASTPSSSTSVEIDTKQRKVFVNTGGVPAGDRIHVAGKNWRLKYAEWDNESGQQKPCRVIGNNTIELNQLYPLFRGTNKDIFRRIQVILAHAEYSSSSKKQFADLIQDLLLREFDSK